jgi:hypothetical protein
MRRTGDFPKDVMIAARYNKIIHRCVMYYLNETWTEYEALTKMVVLLAEENQRLIQQLTDEVQRRPA